MKWSYSAAVKNEKVSESLEPATMLRTGLVEAAKMGGTSEECGFTTNAVCEAQIKDEAMGQIVSADLGSTVLL